MRRIETYTECLTEITNKQFILFINSNSFIMKKYLFIALAAMGFAACAEKAENNVPVNNGEKEQSYMAVTFTADDLTRAEENLEFAEGTDVERAVNLAYVFFFKENGEAFPVTDGNTSTNSGPNNYIKVDLEKEGENMDNVSDVNKSVLVLKNYKGEYPAQVVAVINWNPTEKASYKLSELQTKITTMGDDTNGYVMSNAVYMDHAGKAKYATDLRVENIVKLVAGESAEILMKSTYPMVSRYGIMDLEHKFPAVTAATCGKGKSCYIGGTWGETRTARNLGDFGWIVCSFCEANAAPVVRSEGVGLYELVLRRSADRFFLHAVNLTGEMERPIQARVPLHDVRVTLNLDGFDVDGTGRTVSTLCGTELKDLAVNGTEISFTIPTLAEYEVVVIA